MLRTPIEQLTSKIEKISTYCIQANFKKTSFGLERFRAFFFYNDIAEKKYNIYLSYV